MSTQAVVLNGGSSSGRSAIARGRQAVLPDAWLSLSIETLVDAMPARLTSGDGIGFADDGAVVVSQELMALQDAWIAGLVAMARAGAHLVVDDVHQGVPDDLEVDTTSSASAGCARTIPAHLRSSRGDRAD